MQYPLSSDMHDGSQSANVATRYFFHRFCGCPPEGKQKQQQQQIKITDVCC